MFSLSEAIANKVLSYEVGRDDRGLDISKSHKVWVQAMYVSRIH
jgi:hypothetical protein